jgi:hypothetical protein
MGGRGAGQEKEDLRRLAAQVLFRCFYGYKNT